MASRGIHTVGELVSTSPATLRTLLGDAAGGKLASLADNVDERRIQPRRRVASMGAQAALGRRFPAPELLRSSLGFLADRVTARLRAAGSAGHTVGVRVRFADRRAITRSRTLSAPTSATLTVTDIAVELVTAALADHPEERKITLVAVSVSNLVDHLALQLELPLGLDEEPVRPGTPKGSARWALDRAVDKARARFGREALDYAVVKFGDVGGVPDGFRELAQGHQGDTGDRDA